MALTMQDVVHHHHSDSEDSDFDEFGKIKWEVYRIYNLEETGMDWRISIYSSLLVMVPFSSQVVKRREAAQRDAEFALELDMAKVPKMRKAPGYIDEAAKTQNKKDLEDKVAYLGARLRRIGLKLVIFLF